MRHGRLIPALFTIAIPAAGFATETQLHPAPKALPTGETYVEPFFEDDGAKVSLRVRTLGYYGTLSQFDKFDSKGIEITGTLYWNGEKAGTKPIECEYRGQGLGSAQGGSIRCDFQEDETTFAPVGEGKFRVVLDTYSMKTDEEVTEAIVLEGQLEEETIQRAWKRGYDSKPPKKAGRSHVLAVTRAEGDAKTKVPPQRNSGADADDEAYAELTVLAAPLAPSTSTVLFSRTGNTFGDDAAPYSEPWFRGLSGTGQVRSSIMLTLADAQAYREGKLICRHPDDGMIDMQGYGLAPIYVDDAEIDRKQLYRLTATLDVGQTTALDADGNATDRLLSLKPGTWTCAFQSGRTKLRSFTVELDDAGVVKETRCGIDLGIFEDTHDLYFFEIGEKNIDDPYSGESPHFLMPGLPESCKPMLH